jgi:NADP-dependent 3-hydroxy acid dehydrogenase YdfG
MSAKFNGCVALVTGASSGIDKNIVLILGKMGFTVVLTARRNEELRRFAAAIGDGLGRAFVIPADLTDEGQLANLIEQVRREDGFVDVLVNNAARIELQ